MRTLAVVTLAAITSAGCVTPGRPEGAPPSPPTLDPTRGRAAVEPSTRPAHRSAIGPPTVRAVGRYAGTRAPYLRRLSAEIPGALLSYDAVDRTGMCPSDADALDPDLSERLEELMQVIQRLDVVINDGHQLQRSLLRWFSQAHGGQAAQPRGP